MGSTNLARFGKYCHRIYQIEFIIVWSSALQVTVISSIVRSRETGRVLDDVFEVVSRVKTDQDIALAMNEGCTPYLMQGILGDSHTCVRTAIAHVICRTRGANTLRVLRPCSNVY